MACTARTGRAAALPFSGFGRGELLHALGYPVSENRKKKDKHQKFAVQFKNSDCGGYRRHYFVMLWKMEEYEEEEARSSR